MNSEQLKATIQSIIAEDKQLKLTNPLLESTKYKVTGLALEDFDIIEDYYNNHKDFLSVYNREYIDTERALYMTILVDFDLTITVLSEPCIEQTTIKFIKI